MSNTRGYQEKSGDGLSDLGADRRDSMLTGLQDAVVREGARRRARRVAIRRAGAFSLVIALGVSIFFARPAPVEESPIVSNDPKAPTIEPTTHIVLFKSKPGVLERYTYVPRVDPASYFVDDHALVEALAAIGRPTGLVRRGDRVTLTSFTPDPIRAPAGDAVKTMEKG